MSAPNLPATITSDAALDTQIRWSKATSTAGELLPRQYRDNPGGLLLACGYADALGIPRVNALTGIHLVDGKPTASADLIGALVRRAGHRLRVHGDETYAEAQIVRADDPDFVPPPIRWDLDRARKAGLLGKKGPWQTYPGAMLRARAITEAARMWASDALFGVVYTPEELGERVADDGTPIVTTAREPRREEQRQTGDIVDTTAVDLPEQQAQPAPELLTDERIERALAAIASATSIDELTILAGHLRGRLPAERRDEVMAVWTARKTQIETGDLIDTTTEEPVQTALDEPGQEPAA